MSAYQASRDDEISFVSGAIVRLIKKYADGWWLVRYASIQINIIVIYTYMYIAYCKHVNKNNVAS